MIILPHQVDAMLVECLETKLITHKQYKKLMILPRTEVFSYLLEVKAGFK